MRISFGFASEEERRRRSEYEHQTVMNIRRLLGMAVDPEMRRYLLLSAW
jgi:hypothetical protein